MLISEEQFRADLAEKLSSLKGVVRSVSGPKRSGAIASVYASYFLGVPWIPPGRAAPRNLEPCLIVDTASDSGSSLRKAVKRTGSDRTVAVAIYSEPPRVHFWYENVARWAKV